VLLVGARQMHFVCARGQVYIQVRELDIAHGDWPGRAKGGDDAGSVLWWSTREVNVRLVR
jgi:hypothetical protein